jgi:hypothetical protein
METFNSILEEIIQENEQDIKNVGDLASKINLSAASLSRIKSEKASLTDNVINRIYDYLKEIDVRYAENIKVRLDKIKSKAEMAGLSSGNSAVDSYAKLLTKLSQENSLLIVDNRDFPVSLERFPYLDELTVNAVIRGLSIAMFQPFGSRTNLIERRNLLSKKSVDISRDLYMNVDEIVNSYDYLIRLASTVNNLYWNFINAIKSKEEQTDKKALGQIVLYEAEYTLPKDESVKSNEEGEPQGAIPSLVASGIMSKLFYAYFLDSTAYQTKIYEWVSAQNEELLFVERSNATLNFNAVKMQFNPIPAYWKKYQKLPIYDTELKEAYSEFGVEQLFKEKELIKWVICPSVAN